MKSKNENYYKIDFFQIIDSFFFNSKLHYNTLYYLSIWMIIPNILDVTIVILVV